MRFLNHRTAHNRRAESEGAGQVEECQHGHGRSRHAEVGRREQPSEHHGGEHAEQLLHDLEHSSPAGPVQHGSSCHRVRHELGHGSGSFGYSSAAPGRWSRGWRKARRRANRSTPPHRAVGLIYPDCSPLRDRLHSTDQSAVWYPSKPGTRDVEVAPRRAHGRDSRVLVSQAVPELLEPGKHVTDARWVVVVNSTNQSASSA